MKIQKWTKTLLLVLSLAIVFSLFACNNDPGTTETESTTESTTVPGTETTTGETESSSLTGTETTTGDTEDTSSDVTVDESSEFTEDTSSTDTEDTSSADTEDTIPTECTHTNVVEVSAKPATCVSEGTGSYKRCNDCDKIFNTDGEEIESIPTLARRYCVALAYP